MSQKPRKYDKQFKIDVVEHYLATNESMRNIAKNFGVCEKTFYGWVKEYKQNGSQSFRGQGTPKVSNEEVIILKKAAAIFLSPKK